MIESDQNERSWSVLVVQCHNVNPYLVPNCTVNIQYSSYILSNYVNKQTGMLIGTFIIAQFPQCEVLNFKRHSIREGVSLRDA